MNKAFHKLISLDKPRGQLIKKKCISFLLLMTIAALFATPTAAFARSNAKINDSPSPTTTMTPPSSNGSSNSTTDPLVTIHMLDKTHGWATTYSSILKTADGGLHWQNVLPANAFGKPTKLSPAEGTFLNDQDAWITADVGPAPNTKSLLMHTIMVLRTTNGGKSWQSSSIYTPAGSIIPPTTTFLNASEGWLLSHQLTGTGDVSSIFHTTDGGQHWNQLKNAKPNNLSPRTGIFFKDKQNGWGVGVSRKGAADPAQPPLNVTHDGGQTWQNQPLPSLLGAGKSDSVSTAHIPQFESRMAS